MLLVWQYVKILFVYAIFVLACKPSKQVQTKENPPPSKQVVETNNIPTYPKMSDVSPSTLFLDIEIVEYSFSQLQAEILEVKKMGAGVGALFTAGEHITIQNNGILTSSKAGQCFSCLFSESPQMGNTPSLSLIKCEPLSKRTE